MASQPDLLQTCLQEAAKAARPALERSLASAIAALQVAETQSMKMAERDALANAWRDLQKHKPAWTTQYPHALLAAFNSSAAASLAQLAATAPPVASTGRPAVSSADDFSLVNDAEVSQALEASRLLQQIVPLVEQPLAELDALISAVQGLPNVRPDLNPLRPAVFAEVLRTLVFGVPAEPATRSLWLRQLADPLGRELRLVYERVVNLLELAQVRAASYRMLQSPADMGQGPAKAPTPPARIAETDHGGQFSGPPGSPQHQPAGEAAQALAPFADLSSPGKRSALFQDFLRQGGHGHEHRLTPTYYAGIDEELAALQAAPDAGHAPEDTPLNKQLWGDYARPQARAMVRARLKKNATQVGQVLGLEVVRKLVSQVAQDARLLAPVREAIVALEPSLLRLAMVDPRFFSDEGHAGRRLMERVAQRSFRFNDDQGAEFRAFFEPVARAFNDLNALDIADALPFGAALATLQAGWDVQDQLEAQNRDPVVQKLRFAEERQAKADQIAFDLSARSDLDKVPGGVLDFIFGPWSLAMAHARLTDTRNQIDPLGFASVVPDLLWSVKQEATLQRPAKLIEMIPGLLDKLHTGLDMLGKDPRESEVFFEMLMKLHQPVLKLRRLKSQRDALESGAITLEPEDSQQPQEPDYPQEPAASPERRKAKAADQPWLGRDELQDAGFEDTLPSAPADLPAPQPDPLPASLQPDNALPAPAAAEVSTISPAEAGETLLGLRAGQWVDLYSHHQWLRAQLIWASSKGTLFMFVSHGGQPHSMTKRSCERLIRERLLRPVDRHGVVAQALDMVAAQAATQTAAAAPVERPPNW